ncbi:MAG: hypothetical protein R3F11_27015 [Verrucomicrobiales bacterium]
MGKAKAKAESMAPVRIAPKLTIGDIVSLAEGAPPDLSALIVGEAEADLAADAAALGNPEVRLCRSWSRSAGDALQLAARDRCRRRRAIALFGSIQDAAKAMRWATFKNRAFLARLREITELEPRHLSARTLLILGVQGELRISRRDRYRSPRCATAAQTLWHGIRPHARRFLCRSRTPAASSARPAPPCARACTKTRSRAPMLSADFLAARRAYAEVDDKRTQKRSRSPPTCAWAARRALSRIRCRLRRWSRKRRLPGSRCIFD